jgi:hypothetical protein
MKTAALHPLLVFFAVTNVYSFVLMTLGLLGRTDWLTTPRFSQTKFYVLMGWAPLTFAALGVVLDARYLALFVLAGAAGIGGELLVAAVWRRFFREPIWTYSYRSLLGGHTSALNFLPWTVGAVLLHITGRLALSLTETEIAARPERPMLVCAIAALLGLAIAWPLKRWTAAAHGEFSKPAFAVFCLPIAMVALGLAILESPVWLAVMAAFSLIGFATEYGYGRGMSLFFERGLWTYNHWQIDSGHTSFVTLPLWALGGLYFHFLAACLGL